MRILSVLAGAAGLALAAAAQAPAQTQPISGAQPWAAYYGCWAPVEGARSLALTCLLPVNGSSFEIEQWSLVAGNVVRRVSLRADAQRRVLDDEACEGWESAAFSLDGSRVYTRGSATCGAGQEQSTSGMFSLTPERQFLQVSAVRVGEQRSVTTQRYDLAPWVELPPAMQDRLKSLVLMATGARVGAARAVAVASIEEALQFVDPFVVEAWMAETGAADSDFRITRRELERLVAVNAPTRIIDMSVALANPRHFAPRVERVSANTWANTWANMRQQGWLGSDLRMDAFCDQLQFGMMSGRGSFPLWSMYPGLGLSYYGAYNQCAGRGLYSRWAFGPFGNGWVGNPYYGNGQTPIVVTNTPRTTPGTVSKGSGYTRGTSSTTTGGSGQPRGNSGSSTVRASSGSASSSSGESSSSGGTRSAGSNGSGRTAQPRNPN